MINISRQSFTANASMEINITDIVTVKILFTTLLEKITAGRKNMQLILVTAVH
ncbi:MAG: hypothetical protein IPI88_14485 [Chitinophagaceae bacterium]|nr:hypothetical protein [Chitinophagaceae bacterium]